ncbi:MAG: hypothetical protein ACREPQ_13895 [Rhodanobacter sp.]
MPDAKRMAAAIDLRVRQLEAQGIKGPALVDMMFGHLQDLQWIYNTSSDPVLLDLAQRYPAFERFARVMEDFSEQNQAMLAAGTHPAQDVQELHGSLRESLEKLLRDGVELEREFQDAVDTVRADQAERLDTMRRRWATDLEKLVEAFRASDVPLHAQALLQQGLIAMAKRIERMTSTPC